MIKKRLSKADQLTVQDEKDATQRDDDRVRQADAAQAAADTVLGERYDRINPGYDSSDRSPRYQAPEPPSLWQRVRSFLRIFVP